MTFVPLTRLPWRKTGINRRLPSPHWAEPTSLVRRIDAWRLWLAEQPGGRWLLHQHHPEAFCAALIALWESGRIAVLAADKQPATLARLADDIDGTLPDAPSNSNCHSASQHAVRAPAASQSLDPTSIAVILHTSGSTGEPVHITKRFDQLEAELAAHAELWPLAGCTVISQVSHQHIYGLLSGILHPLCAGIPFCGDESRYPEGLAARLQEAGQASMTPVVVSSPAQLSRLPEHLAWHRLPRPVRVFSSGAPLSLEHAQHSERLLQAPVTEIYGSTETGGIAQRRQTHDSNWQALPGVELSIKGTDLLLRSPFLETPYRWWQQADQVATANDGGFTLLGRADRVVKVAGKRISLTHIEHSLVAIPEVKEARCVDPGRRDGRLGVVVALHEPYLPHHHDSRHALVQRLRSHLSQHLERVATPRYWRFVDSLPSNAQGKLDHGLVNRLFADLDDHKAPRWLGEQRPDAASCRITLEVPERSIFLEGHFTEYPLVPGVVMVQWAIELANDCFHGLGEFQGIKRLKFQRVLRPGARFILHLTRRDDGIAFTMDSHEGRHCSGQVRLQSRDEEKHG